MRALLSLLFVAAVAQATEIDWDSIDRMEVFPENIAGLVDEAISQMQPEGGSRIVGGQEATPGQFPYQAALFSTTPQGIGFCGGSIMNEEWILTAAHCVDTASSIDVRVGAHNVRDLDNEVDQLSIKSKRTIVHASWNPRTIKNDIALVQLSTPITFSDRIQPTRLPSRAQASNTFARVLATVSGWGRASDSATGISPVLRWTTNPIMTHTACNLRFLGAIDRNQICKAGDNGRSACNGDSGGPLTIVDSDGRPTQVGIVSFGSGQGCEVGWPGVYVRITSYFNWIQTNTGIRLN